jgi:hypothetical protein
MITSKHDLSGTAMLVAIGQGDEVGPMPSNRKHLDHA